MNRTAEFRVIADECATTDMLADDMPTDDEELRMTGPSLEDLVVLCRKSALPQPYRMHTGGACKACAVRIG